MTAMAFDLQCADPRDRSQDPPQRQRLEALVRRLSDEQLATPMGEQITNAGPPLDPARAIHPAEHLDEIERTLGL